MKKWQCFYNQERKSKNSACLQWSQSLNIINRTIIQVSITDAEREEVDEVYDQVQFEIVIMQGRYAACNVRVGTYNVKVGNIKQENIVGLYSLENQNEAGD